MHLGHNWIHPNNYKQADLDNHRCYIVVDLGLALVVEGAEVLRAYSCWSKMSSWSNSQMNLHYNRCMWKCCSCNVQQEVAVEEVVVENYSRRRREYHLHLSSQPHKRRSRHYQSRKKLGLYHRLFLCLYTLDNWDQVLNIGFCNREAYKS